MRVIVIAIGTALTAAAVLASGAVAKPAREGKVVRVERPKTFARTTLRICQMESQQIGHGICYGSAPEVDATAEIYDATGYQGRVRVIEVGPIAGNTCGGGSGGDVSFEYIEGQGVVDYSGARLVVFGAGTSSAISKAWADPYNVPPPNGQQGEQPFMVLDRDGNGDPDLLATAYECAAIAPPNPNQSVSMGAYSYVYCIDYWAKESSNEWRKLRQDFFYSCQ